MILGPCRVEINFYLSRPPSIKRSKREFPIVPPDIDKTCRAVLDGLGQGIDGVSGHGRLWADDSIVTELIATKSYADDVPPGARIVITEL